MLASLCWTLLSSRVQGQTIGTAHDFRTAKLSWPTGTQIQQPPQGAEMHHYDGQMYQSDFLFEGATFIL
jgi:hypothetical protein